MSDVVRPPVSDTDGNLRERVRGYAQETGVRMDRAWEELVVKGLRQWEGED